jgi:hypothetical protein
LELVPRREPVVVDLAARLEVAQRGVDVVFEVIRRRLRSECRLVDVDVAEQEETVRAMPAAVVDQ